MLSERLFGPRNSTPILKTKNSFWTSTVLIYILFIQYCTQCTGTLHCCKHYLDLYIKNYLAFLLIYLAQNSDVCIYRGFCFNSVTGSVSKWIILGIVPSSWDSVPPLPGVPFSWGSVPPLPGVPSSWGSVPPLPGVPSNWGSVAPLPGVAPCWGSVPPLPGVSSSLGSVAPLPGVAPCWVSVPPLPGVEPN